MATPERSEEIIAMMEGSIFPGANPYTRSQSQDEWIRRSVEAIQNAPPGQLTTFTTGARFNGLSPYSYIALHFDRFDQRVKDALFARPDFDPSTPLGRDTILTDALFYDDIRSVRILLTRFRDRVRVTNTDVQFAETAAARADPEHRAEWLEFVQTVREKAAAGQGAPPAAAGQGAPAVVNREDPENVNENEEENPKHDVPKGGKRKTRKQKKNKKRRTRRAFKKQRR